jgi:GAF domain-containing protein
VAQRLQGQIPFSLAVLFTYDAVRDELIGEHVFGDVSYLVHDLRIARGDRLSGWVAANRQTIVNSDPALDLGEIARAISPPLRASLSVPLEVGTEVVGVLTLYTSLDDFTPRHQKIAEDASLALAPLVAQLTVAVSVRT